MRKGEEGREGEERIRKRTEEEMVEREKRIGIGRMGKVE